MVDPDHALLGSATPRLRLPDALLSEMVAIARIAPKSPRAATLRALLIRLLKRYPAWRQTLEGAPRFRSKMDALKQASTKLAELEKIMVDWHEGGRDLTRDPTEFDKPLLNLITQRMRLAPRTEGRVEPLPWVVQKRGQRTELDLNVLAAGYEISLKLAPHLLRAFLSELHTVVDALHREIPTELRARGKGALSARDWALHLLADVFSAVHDVAHPKLWSDARLSFVIVGSRLIEPPNGRKEDTVVGVLNSDLSSGNSIRHRRARPVAAPLETNWDEVLTAMDLRSPAAIAVLEPLRERLGEAGPLILA